LDPDLSVPSGTEPPRIGFLFIGGQHQMLHMAPVAAELATGGRCAVRVFTGLADDAARLEELLGRLGAPLTVELLPRPAWLRLLERAAPQAALKLPRIVAASCALRALDGLVVAERTSTILKRLPGAKPRLIHIPHGAGDRAKGFEPRIGLFDHVVVSGDKDRRRMLAEGLVTPDTCSVSGSIKVEAIIRLAPQRPRLFANDRATILYNPHFSRSLGSWAKFARDVVDAVLGGSDANLVIAPHVRFAGHVAAEDRQWLDSLAASPRVIVDLGSDRSSDMTYTRGADLYVGDVSSQVYEYLAEPRPCLFLNATGRDQGGNPDFAFWRFGEVVADPANLPAALARAAERHPRYEPAQAEGVRDALGKRDGHAARRAADAILSVVATRAGDVVELPQVEVPSRQVA